MKVLTICDRYNWGGASQVAKNLHEMLLHNGHDSVYLYGYDKKGLPAKTFPKEVVNASYHIGPHLNYLSYTLIGKNMFPVSGSKLDRLVKDSDLIHIHNIHDYAFNYRQLIAKINKYDKPVVVTCHDSWYITGRCSLPADCINWRNGCVSCQHKDYYHSSLIDRAEKERIRKLSTFQSVRRLMFVSPSKWLFENVSEVYGKDKSIIISNAVDTNTFRYNKQIAQSVSSKPVLLLVASDFKDRRKIDLDFIHLLIEQGIELHIAGVNSPFKAENVINHGRLAPVQLADLMNKCNTHLFLSRIDNQPLVVLESLCAGMIQLTFKDKAITGMDVEEDCLYIEDMNQQNLIAALSGNSFTEKILPEARRKRAEKYASMFSANIMYLNYQSLYHSLLHS
jgi:putative colanic acid biosynthesis glycosyltransferase